MAWSCRSHSPPWSQIGQSSGWLINRNSITPSRALRTIGVLVLTTGGSPFGPGRQSRTPHAQLATGFGEPTSSTRHMRQLPAIDRRSWKQNRGISAPAASHAWSSVYSGGTSISLPSTMSLVISLVPSLRRHAHRLGVRVRGILVDPPFDLGAEMADQALHRPGRAVAERADRVALDLGRDLHQHVDLALVCAAFRHTGKHAPHPAHAFAARRALAAALVLVEIRDAGHGADDVGRLVHHDHGRGTERRFLVAATVEIHQQRVALIGTCRHDRHRRAARDDREQIVPTATHPAGMGLEELAQWNAHRLLDVARLLDMAGDAEQFGAGIVRSADRGEPRGAAAQD